MCRQGTRKGNVQREALTAEAHALRYRPGAHNENSRPNQRQAAELHITPPLEETAEPVT
jgi:hypothetical protein